METLRMYIRLIGISFRGRIQFRADFLVGLVSVITLNAFSLLTIGVVLGQFKAIAGWTLWEIVFLYCLWLLGHSLYSMLFWHIDELEYYLIQGTFDMFLVRPLSPMLQFLGREINYVGFADILVAVSGLVLSTRTLGLQLEGWHFAYLAVIAVSGALIELTLTLMLACIAFWTGRSAASIGTVLTVSFVIQRYPVDMFAQWFRVFVTCLLPVAFLNFYPAQLLLGKVQPGQPWAWLSYMPPVVALILIGLTAVVWKNGLRQYNSAGG